VDGPLINIAAMLQILEVKQLAPTLAKKLGWSLARSGHPESGIRTTPDELVFGVQELIEQTGKGQSCWEAPEFERTHAQHMQGPPCVLATTGGAGITAEFPYDGGTSLCRFLGDQPHPILGHGLLLVQKFPIDSITEEVAVLVALDLNAMELAGTPAGFGFGSYCYDDGCICFTGFLPNCSYRSGLLPNLYFTAAGRAYFADREIS